MNVKLIAPLILGFAFTCSAIAQTTLNDFFDFVQPGQTYFYGDWSDGSDNPAPSFSQGSGVYNLTGGTNGDAAGVYYYLASSLSIFGSDSLALTAQLLSGNAATEFSVSVYDVNDVSATAVFNLGDFSNGTYLTNLAPLTASSGFDSTQVSYLVLSGATFGASEPVAISLDHLAATAIPEPSAYAAMFGGIALVGVMLRRRVLRQH